MENLWLLCRACDDAKTRHDNWRMRMMREGGEVPPEGGWGD